MLYAKSQVINIIGLFFGCKADEKDFYDPKFEKWASTIHIN